MENLFTSVFVATSLDGYIAGENGELDWLDEAELRLPEGEDCGFGAFFDSVDALVMGRNTYDKVMTFGEWPYKRKPVIVLSSKDLLIPHELSDTVSCSSLPPKELCEELAENGLTHLYVDGGKTIQSFLSEGLIDELTITTIPILLGRGIPLFGELNRRVPLKHIKTEAYDFGFVQSKYRV